MTLCIALETDYEGRTHLLDTFGPVVAQCVLQTGPAVYDCDKEVIFAGPSLKKVQREISNGAMDFLEREVCVNARSGGSEGQHSDNREAGSPSYGNH